MSSGTGFRVRWGRARGWGGGGAPFHAPGTAISIETRRSLQLTDEQRDRLADTLRLAEALGGEALTIPAVGRRIADDVIHFAQANNVTQIIIGKATRSLWFEITRGSRSEEHTSE